MSLDAENREMPVQAFTRKMPEPDERIIDEQTGEEYDAKWHTTFGISQSQNGDYNNNYYKYFSAWENVKNGLNIR